MPDTRLTARTNPTQPATAVHVAGETVGGSAFTVIAGPCSVEGRDMLISSAASVRASGAGSVVPREVEGWCAAVTGELPPAPKPRPPAAAGNERDRMALVHMAQAWLELAKQAEKNGQADLWYETPSPRSVRKEAE